MPHQHQHQPRHQQVCISRVFSAIFPSSCSVVFLKQFSEMGDDDIADDGPVDCEPGDADDGNHSYDDEEDECVEEKNAKLRFGLRKWAVQHGISHVALRDVMNLISARIGDNILPRDPRTLLETPQIVRTMSIGDDAEYWHHGLENCLKRLFWNIAGPKTISVNINMDGLPMFNSSRVEFWPILFNITEMPHVPAMPIGIFCGTAKCIDLDAFLMPFADEMKNAMDHGIYINSHKITVRLRSIVCDSPARAYVKGIYVPGNVELNVHFH